MTPRGIRNCNPLNIRRTGKDQWKGMAEVQADRAFVQFKSLEYGCENDTSAYIANVSLLTGIDPDEPIGIPSDRPSRWMAVGVAMAIQENGTTSIDWFAMLKGWGLCRQEV